jgi:prevent-host-death family protein
MAQMLSITKAKQQLLELARRNEETGDSFILIKNGEPVSALLPFEEYESLLETLDILETEPDIVKKLKAAEKGIGAGHYTTWKGGKKRASSE